MAKSSRPGIWFIEYRVVIERKREAQSLLLYLSIAGPARRPNPSSHSNSFDCGSRNDISLFTSSQQVHHLIKVASRRDWKRLREVSRPGHRIDRTYDNSRLYMRQACQRTMNPMIPRW
jgi:hypothetical protein